ncbi:hypothetical protein PQC34_gp072 [Cronobacter phage A24]|uniref:Uncharacterized protein n=1 Tax=Cronobacter phage A24 TaxID=2795745 RepID=A0A7T5QXS7_9CAUD|nr:hypothetical protein PQC34_gp072 [Cronobacter phage A24]QQG33662.1 hypothetical protein [Cronobacter phage A24]WAX14232.1 hypothetical protein ECO319P1_00073 [Escherichia phage ECO319P1]
MEVVYQNGMYEVKVNRYDNEYLVVNVKTDVVEARESALPTAEYKADALREVTLKRNEVKGKAEAAQ